MDQDPYRNIRDCSEEVLEALACAMEARVQEGQMSGIRKTVFAKAAEYIGPSGDAVIVDVGCGTGLITRAFSALPGVKKVIGIDPSPFFLAKARDSLSPEEASRIEFFEACSISLPLADKSVDMVAFIQVLTHLDPEDQLPSLVEANRVLKDGGHILLKDNDLASWSLTYGPTDPLSAPVQTMLGAWEMGKYLCREFPSMLTKAGFVAEKLKIYAIVDDEEDTYGFQYVLLRSIRMHHRMGKCSEAMKLALIDEAKQRVTDGRFQCLLSYGACFGYKPVAR